jgi:hypothetical protein
MGWSACHRGERLGDLIQIAAPDNSSNAANEEYIIRSLIQATPAYELSLDVTHTAYGHSLRLLSYVPTARRPEEQVKFQGLFSTAELEKLRDTLDQALTDQLADRGGLTAGLLHGGQA